MFKGSKGPLASNLPNSERLMHRLIKYYSHWAHSGYAAEIMCGYIHNVPRADDCLGFAGSI